MTLKPMIAKTFCLASLLLPAAGLAEDRALVIGINSYTKSPLEGCKTDADNMYQFIQEVWGYQSSQIRRLTDGQATRQAILAAFDEWLIGGSRPGDRVLFYYSGHGYHLPDDNGDEDDGQDEVLCPVDSESKTTNMIRDDELNAQLRQLTGRQVIVISDSCHSGTLTRAFGKRNSRVKRLFFLNEPVLKPATRSIGLPEPAHNLVTPLNNVITYSAVSPSQLALDGGPQGGVFTTQFIKAIRDKAADHNGDGRVTHGEVLDYVRRESQAYCDQTEKCTDNNGRLTPQLDANPKWLSLDVTTKEATPPPSSPSPSVTVEVAETMVNDNQAQLTPQMLPSTSFRLGEKMQINISSQHTGYLFVLDIDSAGKLTVLFPNSYSEKENRKGILEAGQTITIPDAGYHRFEFEAQEPTGQGLLLALLVEENEAVVRNFQQKLPAVPQRGFGVIEKTSQVQVTLQQLHQKLRQTILPPDGIGRPLKWSMTKVEYQINR